MPAKLATATATPSAAETPAPTPPKSKPAMNETIVAIAPGASARRTISRSGLGVARFIAAVSNDDEIETPCCAHHDPDRQEQPSEAKPDIQPVTDATPHGDARGQ